MGETEEQIVLVVPTSDSADLYTDQVMSYRQEMLDFGSSLDGCGGLENCASYEEWVNFWPRTQAMYGESAVPSTQFIGVRESDGKVVGMIDVRHYLSDFLLHYGGHIGYSVRPSERCKGYAKQMLKLALSEAKKMDISPVLVTCHAGNEGSRRTILANGGVMENEVRQGEGDDNGFGSDVIIQRYWVTV